MTTPAPVPARDHSVSLARANAVAVGIMAAAGALLPLHAALWRMPVEDVMEALFGHSMTATLGAIGASVVVHEALHAVGFRVAGGVPWSEVRFGVKWRWLAPYASTRAPMTARAYRWSAALPGLVLGVVPLLVGLAGGSALLTGYGAAMVACAGGDIAALWSMRGVPRDAIVRDHTDRVGCAVVERVADDPAAVAGAATAPG